MVELFFNTLDGFVKKFIDRHAGLDPASITFSNHRIPGQAWNDVLENFRLFMRSSTMTKS